MTAPLLLARELRMDFPLRAGFGRHSGGMLHAVDGVDLEVRAGECLAIVGESGSGKTTLGRCLLRLLEPTSGRVVFRGEDLLALPPRRLRRRRRFFQMIFQDPYGSLNPRLRIGDMLSEPLRVHRLARGAAVRTRVLELLAMVGLPASAAARFPHEFSGGERQRIGIARALATQPELIVADEAVSALDVSVRAQLLQLLAGLRVRFGLAMIFIGHDLAVVAQVADRIAVLHRGKIVEEGPAPAVLARPQHPYTAALLAAVPRLGHAPRRRLILNGQAEAPPKV